MEKKETESVIKRLRRWQQHTNDRLDQIINGQFPEISQLVHDLLTREEDTEGSEGQLLRMAAARDGLRLQGQIAQLKVTPCQTPRGMVLLVMTVRGYMDASVRIVDELEMHLKDLEEEQKKLSKEEL